MFDSNNSGRGNNSNRGNGNNDGWKAQGFLNLSLPSKTSKSGFRKLAGIPLKDSIQSEKILREWIEKDPAAACAAILSGLKIEYQSAEPAAGSGFDIDSLTAAPAKTGT